MFDFSIYTEQAKRESTGYRSISDVMLGFAARAGLGEDDANTFLMRFLACVMSSRDTALLSIATNEGSVQVSGCGPSPPYLQPTYCQDVPKGGSKNKATDKAWVDTLSDLDLGMLGTRFLMKEAWRDTEEDDNDHWETLDSEEIARFSPLLHKSSYAYEIRTMFNTTNKASWSFRPPVKPGKPLTSQDYKIQCTYTRDMFRGILMMEPPPNDDAWYIKNDWHIWDLVQRIIKNYEGTIQIWFKWDEPEKVMEADEMTLEFSLEASSLRRIESAKKHLKKVYDALLMHPISIVTRDDDDNVITLPNEKIVQAYNTIVEVSNK